jgi:hypothetical protein
MCKCPYLDGNQIDLRTQNLFSFLLLLLLYCFVLFSAFWDRVSLCSPGCPGTHFVDQTGLELRNPPASASQVLGLKACATTTWQNLAFIYVTTDQHFPPHPTPSPGPSAPPQQILSGINPPAMWIPETGARRTTEISLRPTESVIHWHLPIILPRIRNLWSNLSNSEDLDTQASNQLYWCFLWAFRNPY